MQDKNPLWSDEEQAYWLAFDRLAGIGIGLSRLRLIYDRENSLKPLWSAKAEQLRTYRGFTPEIIEAFIIKRKTINPEKVLAEIEKADIQAYPYYHPHYPFRLRTIHDPPLVVYMKGELHPDLIPHCCAVVGTRTPTSYGERLAKTFARQLSANGVAVISGLALGVDSFAHWGAIEGGGKTVAVLASGVDVCYPSSNRPLYKKITEEHQGAVISEFPPGIKPEPWRFPARNRIISGLSEAVLVVEAGETSGSLITAKLAFEQDREVFAIPGRIDNPMSKGTHSLITRNVAHLCTSVEDIMKEMRWVSTPNTGSGGPTVVELFGRERELFELISPEPVHFDLLCERSGIPAPELSATLTMLELAGVVTRHPGDWYSRAHANVTK